MEIQHSKMGLVAGLLGLVVAVGAGCAGPTSGGTGGPTPEMVDIGYGQQAERDVTGAVSTVKAKDVENARVARIEELLEGRVAGLEVVRSAGGISLRIRGVTSVVGSTEPLLVIDGMPITQTGTPSALAALSPYDVDRISVLKGSAAAIYGSRGANGVVLITTRRTR